jgi:hypothetical protein
MKLFKQLAIIALVCYGQSVLAMNLANLGPQAEIKFAVDAMNEDAIVAELQNLHLHGLTLQEEDGDYRIYNAAGEYLCFPHTYLTVLRQLNALLTSDYRTFLEIQNFVRNNPNDPVPGPFIVAVAGPYHAGQRAYHGLCSRIIHHIIENNNLRIRSISIG